MARTEMEIRAAGVRARLGNGGDKALWLTHLPDIRYLTGFTGSHAIVLVLPRAMVLLTDGRYTVQAREETAGSRIRVHIGRRLAEQACVLLLRAGVRQALYDSEHTTVAQLHGMQHVLRACAGAAAVSRRFFVPVSPSPVQPLRERKGAVEIEHVEEAALLGCRLFEHVLPLIRPGTPERDVAAELEHAARRAGADGMSFETIVASGTRSALPHGHATSRPLPRRGLVTLDFGVMLRGYCSDMTRTVCIGRPTREERASYEAVLAAEQAGIAAVAPGVPAGAVDRAARSVLRARGLARYFTHSTGHGVGLEIHEGPRLGAGVAQLLAEGMVLTVEPGVYQPGKFGIRVEDMVLVETHGARVLTPAPTALMTL